MPRAAIAQAVLFCAVLGSVPALADIRTPAEGAPAAEKEAFQLRQQSIARSLENSYGAAKILAKAVAVLEKEFGPEDRRLADYLEELANLYWRALDKPREFNTRKRLLALLEKVPPETPNRDQSLAEQLMMLALWYSGQADFTNSEPLFQRGLDIYRKLFGESSRETAHALESQAVGFRGQGDSPRAQQLLERALAIYEKLPDVSLGEMTGVLISLFADARARGLYADSEKYLKRALSLLEQSKETRGMAVDSNGHIWAMYAGQLAELYELQGRTNEAKALQKLAEARLDESLKRAEELDRADFEHPPWRLQSILLLVAGYYHSQPKQSVKAIPIYERLISLYRGQHGSDSPNVAAQELLLAQLLLKQGDLRRARELLVHSDKILQKAAGPTFPSNAAPFLIALAHAEGRFAEALKLSEAQRRLWEKLGGPQRGISALAEEARLYLAMGRIPEALEALGTSIERSEPRLQFLSASGSEEDKRRLLTEFSGQMHAAVGLHVAFAPANTRARELAFTTILRRKGRAVDAFSDGISSLHKRLVPDDQKKLAELGAARSVLGKLVLHPPANPSAEYSQQVAELEDRIRHLEAELFSSWPELASTSTPVTLDAVRMALPADGALVELIAYQPEDPRKVSWLGSAKPAPASRRYVAYVQTPKGPPGHIELGAVDTIDAKVNALRKALSSSSKEDITALSRDVDEILMRPVRPLLGDAKHIFLAPDGTLNLLPFAALIGEDGRFLIQRYIFTYLGTGRDLVRLAANRSSARDNAVIVANPAFGAAPSSAEKQALSRNRGRRSDAMHLMLGWSQLPATAEEAKTLSELLPKVQILIQEQATEANLKRLSGPRILHIATHGFFLPAPAEDELENPLLRSGLILAGANRLESGGEDGVLTALEASGLDLGGTQLVVLSACETGLGQVQSGDGVYGLRRSLVVAGAETQVMSLWQVDDNATRDLMIGFYRRLRQGKGRSEALRLAQLKLLSERATQHPYYWASFIPAGDWQPMREGSEKTLPATPDKARSTN